MHDGAAFALPFAHVFGGGRRRRRRRLASTGRAVSLAAALVSSAPLILPAGGDAGGARRMWDRGNVGRRKVGGSAHSLILVWRVDPARLVAPRARPGGGRLDRFRWVVLTTATGLEPHAPAESRREQLFFSGATEQHSDDTPTAEERADSNRAGSSGRSSRAGSVVRGVRARAPAGRGKYEPSRNKRGCIWRLFGLFGAVFTNIRV